MITWFRQRIAAMIASDKTLKVVDRDYDAFFESPVWLAVRQQLCVQMDGFLSAMLDPRSGVDAVNAARGGIKATQWLLDAKENLRGRVAKTTDELEASLAVEARLREMCKLMEDERHAGN